MWILADALSWGMFLLGLMLLILILFRRSGRYQRKARREATRPSTARSAPDPKPPLLDSPPEVLRWQVEMHETARDLKAELDIEAVQNTYEAFYEDETFVRIFGPGTLQSSIDVRGSNFCNLSLNVDERTGKLIVVSLIDNLVKGQAGSAVQNMNIMFGLEETAGLLHPGQYP